MEGVHGTTTDLESKEPHEAPRTHCTAAPWAPSFEVWCQRQAGLLPALSHVNLILIIPRHKYSQDRSMSCVNPSLLCPQVERSRTPAAGPCEPSQPRAALSTRVIQLGACPRGCQTRGMAAMAALQTAFTMRASSSSISFKSSVAAAPVVQQAVRPPRLIPHAAPTRWPTHCRHRQAPFACSRMQTLRVAPRCAPLVVENRVRVSRVGGTRAVAAALRLLSQRTSVAAAHPLQHRAGAGES